jgi:hypothetical protein
MTNQHPPFTVEDGKLEISGHQIETEFAVAQAITANGNVVVRLEVPAGKVLNSNVLCFSGKGALVWEIDESPHGGTGDDPYVAISLSESGSIGARTWNGVEYEVCATDGSVNPIGLRRF